MRSLVLISALAACTSDLGGGQDASDHCDVGALDAGQADAGQADAGQVDAGHVDAGQADAGRLTAESEFFFGVMWITPVDESAPSINFDVTWEVTRFGQTGGMVLDAITRDPCVIVGTETGIRPSLEASCVFDRKQYIIAPAQVTIEGDSISWRAYGYRPGRSQDEFVFRGGRR